MNSLPFDTNVSWYSRNGIFDVSLCLLVIVSWFPSVVTIGSTDLGASAFLIAILGVFTLTRNYRVSLDAVGQHYAKWLVLLLGLLVVHGFVGVFRVEDYFRSGRFFLSYGQGVVILLCLTKVASTRALIVAFKYSAAMFLISVLLGVSGFLELIPKEIVYMDTDRLIGFFKNANQHGMILSMAMCYAVAMVLYTGISFFKLCFIVLCLFALVLAGSKTNLAISMLLSMFMFAYFMLSRKRYFSFVFLFPLMVVIIGALGMPLLEYLNPRAASILYGFISGEGATNNSVYQRSFLWLHSIEVLNSNPWFGHGPSQRVVVFDQNHSHSHNVLLDSARTLGVPGIFLVFSIIVLVIVFSLQTLMAIASSAQVTVAEGLPKALVVGSSFAAISYILSNQMSDSFGPSTSVFFWLVVGLLLRRNDLMFGGHEYHLRANSNNG